MENETYCPECNNIMRKEYHDNGCSYFCSTCLKHFNACMSTLYMTPCTLIDDHIGKCKNGKEYWDKDSKAYDKNVEYKLGD